MKLRVRRDYAAVPVLMFHSVGIKGLPWVWADMSEDLDVFRGVLSGLADEGYRTIGLDDLYGYMAGRTSLPPKPVVLTFDDGYLDNWIFVVPLLRRYGMRGTVYVTPEFVPESDSVRPTSDEPSFADGESHSANVAGFMTWAELRAADAEGVLDVQSHALTHTWYFGGPKVVDIHRPTEIYRFPWLSWNAQPARKPYYLTEQQQGFVPWGYPVLEHEKSLVVRRFRPQQAYIDEICGFVAERGGADFFATERWQREMASRFASIAGTQDVPGTTESESEYRDRVRHELVYSREIIESRLNKKVQFLAWPGGGVNPTAVALAREAGYKSWTLSSWQVPGKRNRAGTDPEGIKRVTGRSKVHHRGKWIADGGARWVLHRMRAHQGSLNSKLATAALKLKWLTIGGHEVR